MEELLLEKKDDILSTIEINLNKVTWLSLVITVIFSIIGMLLYMLLHREFEISFSFISILLFFIGYVILIVLHECFHLIGFWMFGKVPWKSMDYGINLKMGIAYATTSIPLPNSAMKKALLLPFWTTGVIPIIIGYSVHSPIFVLLGAFLIGGAELRKYPKDILIKDDPVKPILYVMRKP